MKRLCRRYLAMDEATGTPMAQASVVFCPDLGVAVFFGGGTAPEWRGRGAYTALVNARVVDVRLQGITRVGIFAKKETASPILARRGFRVCGEMVEWIRNQRPNGLRR